MSPTREAQHVPPILVAWSRRSSWIGARERPASGSVAGVARGRWSRTAEVIVAPVLDRILADPRSHDPHDRPVRVGSDTFVTGG